MVEEERGFGPAAEAHCLAALPHESGVAEERYFRRTQRSGDIVGSQLCNGGRRLSRRRATFFSRCQGLAPL